MQLFLLQLHHVYMTKKQAPCSCSAACTCVVLCSTTHGFHSHYVHERNQAVSIVHMAETSGVSGTFLVTF